MTLKSIMLDTDTINNESRQAKQKKQIIKTLSKSGALLTVPDIQKLVKISTPTVIKLVNELLEDRIIIEEGKKETDNGRRPTLYSLNIDKFHAIGVEILLKRVSITVMRLDQMKLFKKEYLDFRLDDTQEALEQVTCYIKDAINECKIPREYILGVGIGITGRVNNRTGESFNYFTFTKKPLAQHLSEQLGMPVLIDNDSHIMGLAEQVYGEAKDYEHVLVLNVSRGLGMTIIFNKNIITGGMGFAGEFGHMQFGISEKLCICGKRGCLGTEVSGYALEEGFKESILKGESSLLQKETPNLNDIRYDKILEAAEKGDSLSISLLQTMGDRLGMALGNIINLLNPEAIIIGGSFAKVGHLFIDSIKMGMHKTALTVPLKFIQIINSRLEKEIGCRAASLQVFKHFDLI